MIQCREHDKSVITISRPEIYIQGLLEGALVDRIV